MPGNLQQVIHILEENKAQVKSKLEQQKQAHNSTKANFKPGFPSIENHAAVIKADELINHVKAIEDFVNKQIEIDSTNKAFYEAHCEHLTAFLIDIDTSFKNKQLQDIKFTPKNVVAEYQKTNRDYWQVLNHYCFSFSPTFHSSPASCNIPAGNSGAAILFFIATFIVLLAFVLIAALFMSIYGLIAGHYEYNHQVIPKGSSGWEFESGHIVEEHLITNNLLESYYKQLNKTTFFEIKDPTPSFPEVNEPTENQLGYS